MVARMMNGESILRSLHLSNRYTGFLPAAYAIDQCAKDEEVLYRCTKGLYVELAQRYGKEPDNLWSEIDYLCSVVWRNELAKEVYAVYSGVPSMERPSAKEFISTLAGYLHRQKYA